MPDRFCRYLLRTTDIEGARSFYTNLLGPDFWSGSVDAGPLPAQAAARGAPSHWLGYIGVDDVVGAKLHFLEHGAAQLGPSPEAGTGHGDCVLRDPFGAMVALTSVPRDHTDGRVAWHLLNVRDEEEAFALYARLFGWTMVDAFDLGPKQGRHITFTWSRSGRAHGGASDLARQPRVHPQWLFFFPTDDLERSLADVRELGGLALPPAETPTGDLVAPCDDPQGAAFALYQLAPSR
jgi:hypothetical protein